MIIKSKEIIDFESYVDELGGKYKKERYNNLLMKCILYIESNENKRVIIITDTHKQAVRTYEDLKERELELGTNDLIICEFDVFFGVKSGANMFFLKEVYSNGM